MSHAPVIEPLWRNQFRRLWPSPTDELLLHAAFRPAAEALAALAEWKSAMGYAQYSDIDFPASRLLTIVYRNLADSGAADAWMPQLSALHRYHLLRNANRQRRLLVVASRLHIAEVKFVVLSGFALLAADYFKDLGERPLLETDLLISPADGEQARAVLRSLEWQALSSAHPPVAGWRSEWWRAADGQLLRLHYSWLPREYPVVGLEQVMQRAVARELGGVTIHVPDATDQLLHTCVSNRRLTPDGAQRFLWVADALRIIQRGCETLDWDRLGRTSRLLSALFPLRESLGYLHEAHQAPVPQEWLADVRNLPLSAAEMRPFLRATRTRRGWRRWDPSVMARPWRDYAAAEQAAGRTPSPIALLRYWHWRLRAALATAHR